MINIGAKSSGLHDNPPFRKEPLADIPLFLVKIFYTTF